MADALILVGGGARGAFTAGVTAELFEPAVARAWNLNVRRVVGSSSGAINGAFLARSLRDGNAAQALQRLSELWVSHVSAGNIFGFSLKAIVQGRGFSSSRKLRSLLTRTIPPCAAGRGEVELAIVFTNLDGQTVHFHGSPATTHEHCVRFGSEAFDSAESISGVFDAVLASSSFPVVFAPVKFRLGDRTVSCMDGGVVNDGPLGYALHNAPDIDRLFVIAPFPRVKKRVSNPRGLTLVIELADVLTEERLFRDLREADRINRGLVELEREVPEPQARARILHALGWKGRRPVKVIEIRPAEELEGNAFGGFFSKRIREDGVSAGAAAVRAAMKAEQI